VAARRDDASGYVTHILPGARSDRLGSLVGWAKARSCAPRPAPSPPSQAGEGREGLVGTRSLSSGRPNGSGLRPAKQIRMSRSARATQPSTQAILQHIELRTD
jgi:hypothetical protein